MFTADKEIHTGTLGSAISAAGGSILVSTAPNDTPSVDLTFSSSSLFSKIYIVTSLDSYLKRTLYLNIYRDVFKIRCLVHSCGELFVVKYGKSEIYIGLTAVK